MKRTSVIVLNMNGRTLLEECLRCLYAQTHPDFEIIVVDNASMDGSVPWIRENHPDVITVALPENLGFAGANARALAKANGEYIALLNNDAFAGPDWLCELVKAMEEDARIGICASKMLMQARPDRLDTAGDGCTTTGKGFKRGFDEPMANYNAREYVFSACGGAVLYRRRMIDDIGFLDTDFFLNCEDTDLGFRAQLAGWKCLYVPTAVVHHCISATIVHMTDLVVYQTARNDEFVWIKNMPLALMLRYLHHKILDEMGMIAYYGVRKGKLLPLIRGKLAVLRHLPMLLSKRRRIQAHKRVTNAYIRAMLTSVFNRELFRSKLKRFFS